MKNMAEIFRPTGAQDYSIACTKPKEAEFLWQKIFIEGEYSHLRYSPGANVVDVGGNIGIFALYAKSKGCHVLTFEPVPDLAACIRQNVPDAEIYEVAVSDENGEVEIDFLPNYTMLSGLNAGANREVFKSVAQDVGLSTKIDAAFEKKTYRCIAKTLSDALQDAGIKRVDILKIDVEMMEDKVLKGITKELWSNIEQVVIEVHDIGDRFIETINLLKVAYQQKSKLLYGNFWVEYHHIK